MDSNCVSNSNSRMMEVDNAASKNACTCSNWTWEEDKAFENALATYYNDADMWEKIALAVPGKTIDDLKLHYEALCKDVEDIESGKVPVPDYPSQSSALKEKKKSGTPWTEEEHRYGKGDWRSISRYCVRTKSNSQVASHAQKFFKWLSSPKDGRRPSINDITAVDPEKLLDFEMATTSCMPRDCKEAPSSAGAEQLLPPNPERANEASLVDEAKQVGRKRSTEEASSGNNEPLDRDPIGDASCIDGKKLNPKPPERSRTCNENQLLPWLPNEGSSTFQNLPAELPEKATTEPGSQLLPPSPFGGSASSDLKFSAPKLPVCEISSPPFTIEPAKEVGAPAPSVELPGATPPPKGATGFYSSDTVVKDAEAGFDGRFDIGSSTEFMDLDLSLFPHFLD